MDTKELDKKYLAHTYGRFPLELVRGCGASLYDENNKKYIDLGAGIAVNTFGVSDQEWITTIMAQANELSHTSNLYYSQPCAHLAQLLCDKSGLKKVFLGNSGAEANECAIKTARLWGLQHKGEGHHTIITLKNSFHGRTVTTLAATGQEKFHVDFAPFTPGFIHAETNNADDLARLAAENNCCAIMLEMIQGEGGVIPLTQEFVDAAIKIAAEHDLLIIVDEVQTGNGRTGKYFAYMHYGLKPDIVSTAKGLGGGLPIGACLFGEKTADVLTPGTHGSTFGGNPIVCAGAVNIVSRLDEKMLSNIAAKGEYIKQQLNGAPGVINVSGLGLMIGIESQRPTADVVADCMEQGVLVLSAHDRVRLLPPLNISQSDLAEAIDILKQVLAK